MIWVERNWPGTVRPTPGYAPAARYKRIHRYDAQTKRNYAYTLYRHDNYIIIMYGIGIRVYMTNNDNFIDAKPIISVRGRYFFAGRQPRLSNLIFSFGVWCDTWLLPPRHGYVVYTYMYSTQIAASVCTNPRFIHVLYINISYSCTRFIISSWYIIFVRVRRGIYHTHTHTRVYGVNIQ